MSAEAWIELIAIVVTLVLVVGGGMIGVIIALLRRNADGTSRSVEKQNDKQASQGESHAALEARVGMMEEGFSKLADAMQRIARLEEWRAMSTQRLDEADETSRAVVALGEQNKTVFKRVDQIDHTLDEMRREQAAIPRQTAEMLRTMIRPVERKTA